MLRHAADRRTLLWAFGLFPLVAGAQIARPELAGWLLPLGLYVGFCSGVFSHNHNHTPTFRSRAANRFFSNYLSFWYGYPSFAWIPTHNQNHHKYVNKAGDATITWRYSKRHTWLVASTYFFVSAYWQSEPIKEFIRKARAERPELFRQIVFQYVLVFGGHAACLAACMALHGAALGAWVYASALLLPALFALWSMIFINYIQHVHCDPWSEHDHSRNFVGRASSWLVFNNGFHTAHHEHAGAHWSQLPELHARIAPHIDPRLIETSMWAFCLKQYLLGWLMPSLRTTQVGRAAWDPPEGRGAALVTAPVDAAEVGVNSQMV